MDASSGTMSESAQPQSPAPIWVLKDAVIDAAEDYIALRDGLMNGHRSKEGNALNAAVKAYVAGLAAKAVQPV